MADEMGFDMDFCNKTENTGRHIPVSIFGSCVSRDALEFDYAKNFDLKTYTARQSVVSAVSPKVDIDENDICLGSKFKKQAICHDFRKDTFELFKNDGSKYLIIDLIDERFGLLMYDNSFITYSAELQESGYIKNPAFISKNIIRFFGKQLFYIGRTNGNKYLDNFCQKISEIYSNDRIFLHKAMMCEKYIDRNGTANEFPPNYTQFIVRTNRILEYMYGYFENAFSGCNVIDIMDGVCAVQNHKWGLMPMHYQDGYYEKMVSELLKAILSR